MPKALHKGHGSLSVEIRVMFEDIVSAFGKDSQFTLGKTAIKSNPLLGLEKVTPVRVHHQGRARKVLQISPQVE